jgi:predicted transcriptional regulator
VAKRPALSKGELEVARVVWERGAGTLGEIYEAVSAARGLDYTTVQTYLRRLELKGYLKSSRRGRTKIYAPKVRPTQVIGETIDDLLNRLFDGEVVPLMRHLIEDRGISDAELQALRTLLDKQETEHDAD